MSYALDFEYNSDGPLYDEVDLPVPSAHLEGIIDHDFSMTAWIKYESLNTGVNAIFSKMGSTVACFFTLGVDNDRKLSILVSGDGDVAQPSSTTEVNAEGGTWEHVYIGYDKDAGDYGTFYFAVDGTVETIELEEAPDWGTASNYDAAPYIGYSSDASAVGFDGIIDELHISNNVRYTENFTPNTRETVDDNTLALFHFDEGSGSNTSDASTYQANAALPTDHDPDWVSGYGATTVSETGPCYQTSGEITNLAVKNSDSSPYLSDQRVKYFGSSRISDIITKVKDWNNSTHSNYSWHDEWLQYLVGQGITAGKIDEMRALFHRTSAYA